MTSERGIEIVKEARERWGLDAAKVLGTDYQLLSSITVHSKPDAILGPTLTDAALRVARRMREEEVAP